MDKHRRFERCLINLLPGALNRQRPRLSCNGERGKGEVHLPRTRDVPYLDVHLEKRVIICWWSPYCSPM